MGAKSCVCYWLHLSYWRTAADKNGIRKYLWSCIVHICFGIFSHLLFRNVKNPIRKSTKKSLASGCVWIHWRCSPRSPGILAAIRAEKGKLEGKGRVKRGRKGKGALPLRFIVLEPPLLKVLCWSCMIWHIDKDWNLQCRFYFPWHTLKKLQENCTRNLHWYTWRESCSLIFQLCLKCKKLAPNGVAFWYKFPAQVSWACVTPL